MSMLAIVFLVAAAHAQDGKVLHHADIANGRPSTVEAGFYQSYETEQGFVLDVGDTLTLAKPPDTPAPAGAGATIQLAGLRDGATSDSAAGSAWYPDIYNGTQTATMAKAILAGMYGTMMPSLYMAPLSLAGTDVRVTRIRLAGTRKRPYVWAECTFVNSSDRKNASGIITIGDVDKALRMGEVTSPEHVTREVAIQKLKEAKELLDLGILTKAQYEAEKARYLPFVVTP
jgi:hypothetical protein